MAEPTKQITKILIANRGEIACRIARTCRKMGIRVMAVYSDADVNAKFVREADDAIGIGGTTSTESYLNSEKIIRAAKECHADAIHPGYGFLSENADFAKAANDAGLIFIGPSPATIKKMGSKIEAKNITKKAGVPVIPGYQGNDQKEETLAKEAEKIGFPCFIKASAGGGGKGLKLAQKKTELKDAIQSARREAKSSFGDDTLLIEKYIIEPRHIEIQIFGDTHGNIIHLFERECSLQRRHQKVIEEAPSPVLTEQLRNKMGQAAIKAAKAVQYIGAGTVEFIVDNKGNFYFLEMNTRLQVEHPVTEFITGLDLVEWQILIAQGEKLPLTQKQLTRHGHAMEARVYAEDPLNNFLPASGKIFFLDLAPLQGVRYDFGVDAGDDINVYYDPMIGKIIAHDQTRQACIQRLSQALKQTTILGTTTNLWFLNNLIVHAEHLKGNFHTAFIDQNLEHILAATELVPEAHCLIAASLVFILDQRQGAQTPLMNQLAGFRMANIEIIRQELLLRGVPVSLGYRVINRQVRVYEYLLQNKKFEVICHGITQNKIQLSIGRHRWNASYARNGDELHFKTHRGNLKIEKKSAEKRRFALLGSGSLSAPLPGKVLKIFVKPNQKVKSGDTLMIIEAMKMEHPIKAHSNGTVKKINYHENDSVKLGDHLIEVA